MLSKPLLVAAGILGFSGVALGAFGAHALKAALAATGGVDTWKTAVLYHLIHAVAVLALSSSPQPASRKIGGCWIAGVVLFSGSLYALALGGPKFLGPITPLGGVAFLIGWAWLAVSAWKQPAA
ncbi:MAG TPA: DUF423 domain-containing protein [Lacunisphaera sp.]|nr:DUF423 domain-containing protein [Lacunisphaera sp.]